MQILKARGLSQAWTTKWDFLFLLSVFLILYSVASAAQAHMGREDEGRSIQIFSSGNGYTVTYTYNPIGLCSVLLESRCFSLPLFFIGIRGNILFMQALN